MRSAFWPMATVSGVAVKSAVSGPENAMHSTVPTAMMPAHSAIVSS